MLTKNDVDATARLILSLAVTITSPEPNCCSLKSRYNSLSEIYASKAEIDS